MIRLLLVFTLSGIVSACGGLPRITPATDPAELGRIGARCQAMFPQQAFRAVHAIEASLPLGKESSVLGVSVVDPASGQLRAVLVSVEGLTLFDASSQAGSVTVHRAVPPLDERGFGRGLVDDVGLVLLAPGLTPSAVGRLPDARPVCRYEQDHGRVTDVLPLDGEQCRRLDRYDGEQDLVRRVEFTGEGVLGLATSMLIRAPGIVGYELRLKLVEAETINPKPDLFLP
jgi:hypothetical protein